MRLFARHSRRTNFSYLSLLIATLFSLFLIFNLYYIFKTFGLDEYFNKINTDVYVPWLRRFFYPKNYAKLFYNFTIIFLPVASLLLSPVIERIARNKWSLFFATTTSSFIYLYLVYFKNYQSLGQLLIINTGLIILLIILSKISGQISLAYYFSKIQTAKLRDLKKSEFLAAKTVFSMLPTPASLLIKSLPNFLNKYSLIVLLILLLVVLVNFAYLYETGIWVNYYHHNFVMGTINDLLHGKHLLIDSLSQYGLFLPLFLYFIFLKVLPFSYMNLYLLFMIITVIYYLILFFFLKALTKSNLYSLVGLFLIMGVNTLFNYPTFPVSENYVWPGGTVMRYFFDATVFLVLLKNKDFSSRLLNILASFLVAVAVLYNFETGIALAAAFLYLHLFHSFSFRFNSPMTKTISLFKNVTPFLVSLLTLIGVFSFFTYFQTNQFPNWNLFLRFPLLYMAGRSNAVTPEIGWYLPYLLLYFSTITIILYNSLIRKSAINWKWTVLAAYSIYGLLLLNYYFSRSYYSNLTVVSIPAGVIFIVLIQAINQWLKSKKYLNYYFVLRSLLALFVIAALVIGLRTTFYLYKRINYRIYALNDLRKLEKYPNNRGFIVSFSEPAGFGAKDLLSSVAKIKELTKDTEKILLISRYETVILVMSKKTNVIDYPLLEQITYTTELEKVKRDLVSAENKPQYLFVDKDNPHLRPSELPTQDDMRQEIIDAILHDYEFLEQVGVLDIFKMKFE